MTYVVHITGWGYYMSRSEKYYDMYNISPFKKYGKKCSLEEAEKLKDWLQRANDTKVVIEEWSEEE